MPKINLSTGPGFVSIAHGFVIPKDGRANGYQWYVSAREFRRRYAMEPTSSVAKKLGYHQGTRIVVEFVGGKRVEAISVCKLPDQFNRLKGRQLAAKRLAGLLSKETTAQDREAIFKIIFP